jgi:hypothetical protein
MVTNIVTHKQTQKQIVKLTREDKALQVFQAGAVSKIEDDLYYVKSQTNASVEYEVIPSMNVCNCEDFLRHGLPCKHVIAVQIYRTNQIAAVVTAAKIQALNKIGVAQLLS